MLRQRVATSLLLAAVLIAGLAWLPQPLLATVLGAVVALAAWEWAALAGYRRAPARAAYALVCGLALFGLYRYCGLAGPARLDRVQPLLGLACLWWALALLWVRSYPASAPLWGSRVPLNVMGLLVLLPPGLAALYLLNYDSGRLLLLAVVVVVAAADIGAWFVGRRYGRHRLAAAVSPAKSWEGFCGGLAACLLLAALLAWWLPLPQLSRPALFALIAVTALASVLGDLLESMVKRHCGVKDSGTLLPGHGGLLDRIDGLTAALPVFALGLIVAGWQP